MTWLAVRRVPGRVSARSQTESIALEDTRNHSVNRLKFGTAQTGSVTQGLLIAILAVVVLVVGVGGCGVSKNNSIIAMQEGVDAHWSEIRNQYKRRYELIPQLVKTVKGAADFEASTLQGITEARASVGKLQLPDGAPTDPAQLDAFMKAQGALGSSLSRLLVVAEQYPQLRATQSFLSLQDQLEGTDNRIAVARRDYIDAIRGYNTAIRSFPGSLIASFRGFEKYPQLQIDESVEEVPEVDFGSRE
jgi:LemA protein